MEEACGNESIEIETKTDMKEDPEFEEGGTGSSVDVKKGMIGQGEESDDEVRLKPVPGGFTSEIFKIEIKNIPPYAGYKQIQKRLNSLDLKPVKIKIVQNMYTQCFVTFKNEDQRQLALSVINGHVWKKRKLNAIHAKPAKDPLLVARKRKIDEDKITSSKRLCLASMTEEERREKLFDSVTDLWRLPYSKQLEQKHTTIKEWLVTAAKHLNKINPGEWFHEHIKSNNGLLCQLLPIKPSPVTEAYRNKCEFLIGYGPSRETVIGFMPGSFLEGDVSLMSPRECINVSQYSKDVVQVFEDFVKTSDYKAYDLVTHAGNWKLLTVKDFTSKERMIIITFNKGTLSEEEIDLEKKRVIKLFQEGEGKGLCPTSLYWLTVAHGRKKADLVYELLLGTEVVHEYVNGLKFSISPEAFFQVNTLATETLYSTIADLVSIVSPGVSTPPVLYDICCGTGTIGLSVAKTVPLSQVIGIELNEQAVKNAEHNAVLNGITNCRYMCGRAEDVIPSHMLESYDINDAIAIVDPPRSGLHAKVIQAIRRNKNIKNLIYVSCDPDRLEQNIADLCRERSHRIKGLAFRPVKAIPIDLFPHTDHCEVVLLFERLKQDGGKEEIVGEKTEEKEEDSCTEKDLEPVRLTNEKVSPQKS